MRLKTDMVDFRNKNICGQKDCTRSRTLIDRVARRASLLSHKYQDLRSAILTLLGPGDWEQQLRVLLESDVRSYVECDLEANLPQKNKKKQAEPLSAEDIISVEDALAENTRAPAGEGRRMLSWIWIADLGALGDDKAMLPSKSAFTAA